MMKWLNRESPGFQKKKKLLMTLPLVVVPLLTLLFIALGGGRGPSNQETGEAGFNTGLPAARLKLLRGWTKLNFYQQADLDSERSGLKQVTLLPEPDSGDQGSFGAIPPAPEISNTGPSNVRSGASSGQGSWQESIARIRQLVKDSLRVPDPVSAGPGTGISDSAPPRDNGNAATGPDPQLEQMNAMLDKILAIQHPGTLPVGRKPGPEPRVGPQVKSGGPDDHGSSMDSAGFYGLDPVGTAGQNATPATIAESCSLLSGATVGIRTSASMDAGGLRIPEGELIYGKATLEGDRLLIRVQNIRWQNSIFPVSLSVFDQDGLEGIHIPGAINRDLAKESGAQGVDALDYSGPGTGIADQVAGAGISAARNILDRRIRLVRVSLPAGYPVLLVQQ